EVRAWLNEALLSLIDCKDVFGDRGLSGTLGGTPMAAFLTKPLFYGVAVSITALCTLLAILLETVITPDHPGHVAVPVFLVGVILSARVCHLGPALLAAGLSYVTADYLFIPPLYSVDVGWNDVPLIGCFVLTAGVVDLLTKKR